MKTLTRRSFVKAISTLGSGGARVATPVSATMRVVDFLRLGDRRFKLSETRSLMGSRVSITAVHESKDAVIQGIEAAFAEMERLAAIFDRHQPNTPVSLLNETGRLTDVVPELRILMEKARSFYRASDGAFDPTVLPVVDMIKRNGSGRGKSELTRSDLDDALALVGAEQLKISDNEIRLNRTGMAVTLDGIGKGFIVDRASEVLAYNGLENHLIDAGGDIRAGGERSPGQPWIVAIEDPGMKGWYPAVIQLKNAAVATSGGYEVYFDADHNRQTVTPQAAMAGQNGVTVSVIAPSVMEADALSTSAFVMESENAVRFINGQKNSECLLVSADGRKLISSLWKQMVMI